MSMSNRTRHLQVELELHLLGHITPGAYSNLKRNHKLHPWHGSIIILKFVLAFFTLCYLLTADEGLPSRSASTGRSSMSNRTTLRMCLWVHTISRTVEYNG